MSLDDIIKQQQQQESTSSTQSGGTSDPLRPNLGKPMKIQARLGGGLKPLPQPVQLVVSNLAVTVTESDIKDLFSEFGFIYKTSIEFSQQGKNSRGTARVIFRKMESAVKAKAKYNGIPLDGLALQMKIVEPPPIPTPTPSPSLQHQPRMPQPRMPQARMPQPPFFGPGMAGFIPPPFFHLRPGFMPRPFLPPRPFFMPRQMMPQRQRYTGVQTPRMQNFTKNISTDKLDADLDAYMANRVLKKSQLDLQMDLYNKEREKKLREKE